MTIYFGPACLLLEDDSTVNLDKNESEMKEVAKSLVLQT